MGSRAAAGTGWAEGSGSGSASASASGRARRSKMLVPADRKALFQLVTHLIDPSSLPVGLQLNATNFVEFVPVDKMPLLETLREVLLFEC